MNRRKLFLIGCAALLPFISKGGERRLVNTDLKKKQAAAKVLDNQEDIKTLLDPATVDSLFPTLSVNQRKFFKGLQKILKLLLIDYIKTS